MTLWVLILILLLAPGFGEADVEACPQWLLDEPTVGIDAASIGLFGQMLAVHRARGGVVVGATHVPLPLPRAKILGLA
jgi:ABC-type transport system involved in cytochrome c biogenesis ATPase subunit